MNISDIEKVVHEYDNSINIDMIIEQDKVSCYVCCESLKHEFHMKLETLKELTRLIPQDISKFIGENIVATYKADINYIRLKKIKRLI